MADINQLSSASSISDSDLFAIWQSGNSDTRKVAFSVISDALAGDLVTSDSITTALGFLPLVAANKILRFTARNVVMTNANTDVALFSGLPAKYRVRKLSVYDAAAVPAAATLALFGGPAGTGAALVAAGVLTTLTANTKVLDMTLLALATSDYQVGPTLYARCVAANVAALTVSIGVEIEDLT